MITGVKQLPVFKGNKTSFAQHYQNLKEQMYKQKGYVSPERLLKHGAMILIVTDQDNGRIPSLA